jgi:hypothetical protein
MSIHISLSYQKKKEDYNKEDVLGVCLFYYFNKKKIKISTGVKTKFKDWNFNWEKTHSKEIIKKRKRERGNLLKLSLMYLILIYYQRIYFP